MRVAPLVNSWVFETEDSFLHSIVNSHPLVQTQTTSESKPTASKYLALVLGARSGLECRDQKVMVQFQSLARAFGMLEGQKCRDWVLEKNFHALIHNEYLS